MATKAELAARIVELEAEVLAADERLPLRSAVMDALDALAAEAVEVESDKRVSVLLLASMIDSHVDRLPCQECGQKSGLETTWVNAIRELRIGMKELRPVGSGVPEALRDWLDSMGQAV